MPWSVEMEKTTIPRARNGDPHAFAVLYRNYSDYVYRRCLRLTGDPLIAEDLSQDVFVQVWRKLSTFHGQSKFKTWLYRVATNMVYTYWRRNRRTSPPEQWTPRAEDKRTLERCADSGSSRLDDHVLLRQAVSVLAPQHRAVLMLHDADGYTHEEIARILGIASGTSKSNLSRARRRIRITLGPADSGPPSARQQAA